MTTQMIERPTKDQMVAVLLQTAPATKHCPKCKLDRPIAQFGMRTTHHLGVPVRVQWQSWCTPCRGGAAIPVVLAPVAPAPMTWGDAIVVALAGAGTQPLSAIYGLIEGFGSLAAQRTKNINWRAKVRQVMAGLAAKGTVTSPAKGMWALGS